MKWEDKGVILKKSIFGENAFIITCLTPTYGLQKGLLKKTKKNHQCLEPGTFCNIQWQGRLEEHLGQIKIDIHRVFFLDIMDKFSALLSLIFFCNFLSRFIPERHIIPGLFEIFLKWLEKLCKGNNLQQFIHWELCLLKYFGYGLNYSCCAVSGKKEDLIYISPNTGNVVTKEIGWKYRNKLFSLPSFFYKEKKENCIKELEKGLNIVTYFMEKHFLNDFPYLKNERAKILPFLRAKK